MKHRISFFLISLSLLVALRLDASLVRVIGVADGRTLVVERGGAAVRITLAGIELTDDGAARSLMQWTLVSTWVMLEEQPGGFYVYRSPDALFVNRELVARGFARATLPSIEPAQHVVVTYLGTIDPDVLGARRRGAELREGSAKSPTARGSGNAESRPAPSKPSRPRRRRKP